ncbi:hypothetical protein C5167_013705 [Papaver somniferum]|uniref:Tr-type G domain-containing protein n=1 Tax=Papaver somniferum TaxID=3469 RepID=A0A4Y7J324_PAPSO|nr:hypothetical protein C5167_013705 [Papaver somniferum]
MDTMLNGAAIMDGAPLLVARNESCPQPQTSEHPVMGLQHIIILQNKVGLIQDKKVKLFRSLFRTLLLMVPR